MWEGRNRGDFALHEVPKPNSGDGGGSALAPGHPPGPSSHGLAPASAFLCLSFLPSQNMHFAVRPLCFRHLVPRMLESPGIHCSLLFFTVCLPVANLNQHTGASTGPVFLDHFVPICWEICTLLSPAVQMGKQGLFGQALFIWDKYLSRGHAAC